NFGKRFNSLRADQDAEPGINHSAGDDDFETIGGGEEVCNRKGVGNDLRGLALKMAGHVIDGGAGINDHRRVILDQLGAGLANSFFLGELMSVARRERELVRPGTQETCATMGSFDVSYGLKHTEVASNCRDRGPNLFGDLVKSRKFNGLQILGNAFLTLFR